jgi:hypothetical protein
MKLNFCCVILIWLFAAKLGFGQNNLLLNGNFEATNTNYSCHYYNLLSPNFLVLPGPVQFLSCPNNSSPDYFNSCVTDTTGNNFPGVWSISVPYNLRCYQNAKSGSGYIGMANWTMSKDEREYITLDFKSSLLSKKNYYFEVGCNQSAWHGYFSNDLAALFHDSIINVPGGNSLNNYTPQIVNTSNLIDTLNWRIFSGLFVAQGGENFVSIGNFKYYLNNPDTIKNPWWNLSPSWVIGNIQSWPFANYILLDDAWLIALPEISLPDTIRICLGDSVELKADTTGLWQGIRANWIPANGLDNPSIFNPIATPTQTTTYYLTLMDTGRFAHALTGNIDSVTVIVNTDFTNISLSNDTSVCKGDTVQISTNCYDCGLVSYHWSPEAYFLNANQNPAFLVASNNVEVSVSITSNIEKICFTGNHPINITIKNEEDCLDLDSDEVIIPNSITPDKFWIISGLENPEVSIWDARGRVVFYSNSYKNNFMVKEAKGIYFYKVNSFGVSYSGKLIISP